MAMNLNTEIHGRVYGVCPYCRGLSKIRFTVPPLQFQHCTRCGLHFRTRAPEENTAIIEYYKSKYYDNEAYDQLGGHRNDIFAAFLDIIENERTGRGDLLDVGCGCGIFLKMAEIRGWNVAGLDLSEKSIKHARSLVSGQITMGSIADYHQERRFDVVTLINVLDHLTTPWRDLRKIINLMRSGGHLFLRFPNGLVHPPLIRFFMSTGLAGIVRKYLIYHEYSFTPGFMKKMLTDCHFTDVRLLGAKLTVSGHAWEERVISPLCKTISLLSKQKVLLTPSLIAVAKKP